MGKCGCFDTVQLHVLWVDLQVSENGYWSACSLDLIGQRTPFPEARQKNTESDIKRQEKAHSPDKNTLELTPWKVNKLL